MNQYQSGCIYKIIRDDTDRLYIGHTTKAIETRLQQHEDHLRAWQAGAGDYRTSFDLINRPGYRIELVEAWPCNSKDELCEREQHYIDMNRDKVVNQATARNPLVPAGLRGQEYNRAWGLVRNRQKIFCPCGGQYTPQHRKKHEGTLMHREYALLVEFGVI